MAILSGFAREQTSVCVAELRSQEIHRRKAANKARFPCVFSRPRVTFRRFPLTADQGH